jgi:molybdopterin converting factor small subunit
MSVTVEFLGISAIGGGHRRLELSLSDPTPVLDVMRLASDHLGEAVSPEQLEKRYLVLVEGRNILYQDGWDTVVQPGQKVSVVPLLGGG